MILGVDFDNTLVCYDGLFHAAAVARGLMPEDGPQDKDGVRDWLIERGQEEDFTHLQGEVYGPGLRDASIYPGAMECLREIAAKGIKIYVISHKTKRPVLGLAYDLRKAALDWLDAKGFFTPGLLCRKRVFFEDTMMTKVVRIAALGCTHFIDDMDRFLECEDFPDETTKIWFHPFNDREKVAKEYAVFSRWSEIATFLTERACYGRHP